MKNQRRTFKCWNCNRNYTLLKEISQEQVLIVACPFCNKDAVVKLEPFKKKVKSVMRGVEDQDQSLGYEYEFPEVIPTQEPE